MRMVSTISSITRKLLSVNVMCNVNMKSNSSNNFKEEVKQVKCVSKLTYEVNNCVCQSPNPKQRKRLLADCAPWCGDTSCSYPLHLSMSVVYWRVSFWSLSLYFFTSLQYFSSEYFCVWLPWPAWERQHVLLEQSNQCGSALESAPTEFAATKKRLGQVDWNTCWCWWLTQLWHQYRKSAGFWCWR